jgi:hypothetical protein
MVTPIKASPFSSVTLPEITWFWPNDIQETDSKKASNYMTLLWYNFVFIIKFLEDFIDRITAFIDVQCPK